jgi:hypothetical protein
MLDDLLTTLFLVVMFGLGILVGLVAVMLGNDLPRQLVALISIGYLGAVFAICLMLMGQVKKVIDARLSRPLDDLDPVNLSVQLRAPDTAELPEYREPVGSVTDRTTRTLEKLPAGESRS